MRAVIYTRVSSDPRETGRSVDEQEAECRQVCRRKGWTVDRVFCDNDRGASRHSRKDRPQYRALREYLNGGGADVLVLWEGSRAQRDLADYLRLRDLCIKRGILYNYSGRTYDLSRTDDRFSTGLDALLAEREADVTRDRVLRAVRANAATGRPHGKLLYGYGRQYDERGNFVRQYIREDEADVVREAAKRVASGESCYSIAMDFNTRGIPSPRRGLWDLTRIRRMVTNPGYIGQRIHQGVVVGDAQWPAILDQDTFMACKTRMEDPRRKSVRDTTLKHLLSGAACCGSCGSRMRVLKNRGYPSYTCMGSFCVTIKMEKLDDFVTEVVLERLSRPDVIKVLSATTQRGDFKAAEDEATQLRARLDGFYAASAAGEISPRGLAAIESRLLVQIQEAEHRAHAAHIPQVLRDVATPDIRQRWHTLPVSLRREVIHLLMSVRLKPVGRGRRTFRPERVEIEWKPI